MCPADLGKRRAKRSRKVPDRPPQKRSPAPGATGSGTKRFRKASQKQNTKSDVKAQAVERHSFAVYDGQVAIGLVEQADQSFAATTPDGRELGVFSSLKAAADAISAAYRGGA
jgi:hypothetical protein